MRSVVRRHPVASYLVLAFGLAWAWWVPMAIRGEVVRPGQLPTHFPGLLGPAVAAVLVAAACDGWGGVRALAAKLVRVRRARWIAFALLSPIALWLVAAAVIVGRGGALPPCSDFGVFPGLPVMSFASVFAIELFVNGVGEETGWRGFMLPRLRARHSALASTLMLAPVWAAWHLPMFWMNATMLEMSAPMMTGFVIGLTCGAIVLTWLYYQSGESLLATALWHASYNMVSATAAAAPAAAIVTTGVMAGAIALVVGDLRARRRGRPSPLDPRSRAATSG